MAEIWRIEVDREACLGSGLCAATAPEHFVIVDGRSRPVAERAEPAEAVVDAAESCPIEAILVRADDGRVIAPEE
ncbi:ferredoxin [Nocardia transvalensis]|uniref:Ferredoxin n=1 Tax=Nocardia transvalensis TaxID=37333 RepID=A0A7W9UI64_9NOCA|nr:ferredoxin [Nocardia transvalensis]MBB5913847.1 ferredoxin [Nocardia transvalensis]